MRGIWRRRWRSCSGCTGGATWPPSRSSSSQVMREGSLPLRPGHETQIMNVLVEPLISVHHKSNIASRDVFQILTGRIWTNIYGLHPFIIPVFGRQITKITKVTFLFQSRHSMTFPTSEVSSSRLLSCVLSFEKFPCIVK